MTGAVLRNLKHNRVLHERVVMLTVRTEETPRMALWRESLFIALNKLSQSAPDFYRIPADRVIEVGTKVEI